MQIGRRIYHELSTGNVIVDTGERQGSVVETTVDDDFATYVALAQRVPSTVGVLSLTFGELASQFASATSYRVDVATSTVIFDTTPAIPLLDVVKQRKIAELSATCNTSILAGFTSNALGVAHSYDFDEEAQRNLAGRLGVINANPNYPAVFKWKTTDAGPLDHTKPQFTQLCVDADSFKDGLVAKYWTLKSRVNAATDVAAVNAILW